MKIKIILTLFLVPAIALSKINNKILVDVKNFKVYESFDTEILEIVKKFLKMYRSDYSSVVIINNDTGEVLTAIDYIKKTKSYSQSLTFQATHPAASLMKIVTAAALLEGAGLKGEDVTLYRGKSNTLYKYQLRDKRTKWTRTQSFKRAFASSNNVVFGKLAINSLTAFELFNMAEKFSFNKKLNLNAEISPSIMVMAESEYHMAEIASGLNNDVFISPIHGALLAQSVINDGQIINPRFSIGEDKKVTHTVFSKATSEKLKNFMGLTVLKGTARKSFSRFMRTYKSELLIGGKTGTITGGIPYGRRDWFVAYAKPLNKDLGIPSLSICVMNINVKKWYVKSSLLATNILNSIIKKKRVK